MEFLTLNQTMPSTDDFFFRALAEPNNKDAMKSVKGFPSLAGDPTNIQFLTRAEHLFAHGGNWRNITYGRHIL